MITLEAIKKIKQDFQMVQDEHEVFEVCKRLEEISPEHILEIGVERGGSSYLWGQLLGEGGYVLGIDVEDKVLWHNFGEFNNLYRFIQGDSTDVLTIHRAKHFIDIDSIDFLFIDGSHEYEDVKKDFYNYKNFVRRGGIIGFHDIAMSPYGKSGVTKLWNEIKERGYTTEEIHKTIGIGLVYV